MSRQTRQAEKRIPTKAPTSSAGTFWRVEGSLVNLGALRPVGFFTWNSQSFVERWARRFGFGSLALIRPLLYATNRAFATRVLHTLLRGVSQDRLDLLGEEYFHYVLRPRLKERGIHKLREVMENDDSIILVSQGLDHVMRPLAEYLGIKRLVANRLEFRDGLATGRLLDPVIRPRGAFARITSLDPDGRIPPADLCRQLGLREPDLLNQAVTDTGRRSTPKHHPVVLFEKHKRVPSLSVRDSLAGKQVLLIGCTGFIGKVWLAKALREISDIGKIYLLIRPGRSTPAVRRFEKIVQESPVFEWFREKYGAGLADFLRDRIEVVEGDVGKPGLGLNAETARQILDEIDLVINSSGLTDFNPDLRDALIGNVDAVLHILDFIRQTDHAALLHLSTCYVVGNTDGRVNEELEANYTPAGIAEFDADQEYRSLAALVSEIESQAKSGEVTAELTNKIQRKRNRSEDPDEVTVQRQLRKDRIRWTRNRLVEAGMSRARELGWPNTYTFTKSLAESMIASQGEGLPIAIVRPSIVETSTKDPFKGWNEGVNTSAPISYLLGTYFRQLPSNERKCLDLIPVDMVCRGMSLIAAALLNRLHEKVYQLATSGVNPCNMRRSVELTGLAHRKHYRAQNGFEHRLRAKFDSIPVSKARYQNLSAPRQKAVVQAIQRVSSPLPLPRGPLARKERGLDRVERLIELYEPFILYNEYVFEAENVQLLAEALSPDEREAFGYDPMAIDWWDYWINIHIPALRKWSYPLIEGRPIEYIPQHSVDLSLNQSNGGGIALAQ